MLEIPSLSTMLDEHLLAKAAAEGDREVTGGATWRASRIGSCLKQQYLEFHLKQPKVNDFDAQSLRRFEVGHSWSRQFAKWFEEMGFSVQEEVEFYDEELDLGAHADFILDREDPELPGRIIQRLGVELKSVNSRAFWHDDKAPIENMLQAACYDILYRKKGLSRSQVCTWLVLRVSKDDLTMNQHLVTEHHRDMAMERLEILNTAKKTGVAPPCTCTEGDDPWHYKYCGYAPQEAADDFARRIKNWKSAVTRWEKKNDDSPKPERPEAEFECCVEAKKLAVV